MAGMDQLKAQLNNTIDKINKWLKKLPDNLKNLPETLKSMSQEELISYACIVSGAILVLAGILML